MSRKILGLMGFAATGAGLLAETILQGLDPFAQVATIAIIGLFIVGLSSHFKELMK